MTDSEVPAGPKVPPNFPWRTVSIGIALLILVASTSILTAWLVGNRLRTISENQLSVLGAAEQLQVQRNQQVSSLETQAVELLEDGQIDNAKRLLGNDVAGRESAIVHSGFSAARDRSSGFVAENRRTANRYLGLNLLVSICSMMLLSLAGLLVIRPARRWAAQLSQARERAQDAARASPNFSP